MIMGSRGRLLGIPSHRAGPARCSRRGSVVPASPLATPRTFAICRASLLVLRFPPRSEGVPGGAGAAAAAAEPPADETMKSQRIAFEGALGHPLAARLDLPASASPGTYALFAHCFTCSKDLKAVARLSRALTDRGVAVLRFDFTGLGESEGDFADTNFTSNREDLLAAVRFLEAEHGPPELLIGICSLACSKRSQMLVRPGLCSPKI